MNSYLEKHRFCEGKLEIPINPGTDIIVVIPCYNEPSLLTTLKSLFECEKTLCPGEIIIVINSGEHNHENVLKQNQKTYNDAISWIKDFNTEDLVFHLIHIKNLPKKHAGVGLARKIGMDEAVARFENISKPDGIIVCLDADCTVDKNYLTEIEKHFQQHSKATGCSIYFEHPVDGKEFSKENYEGIINYELFLRYYNRALHFCIFPNAFHTIGSSMAVKNRVYQKQGGMNRRKAGEDFYFLHKIFPLGSFTELNSTKIIPSPRESDRVPFGTGNAMKKFISSDSQNYFTYNIQTFIDLQDFLKAVPNFYASSPRHSISTSLPLSIQKFLLGNKFEEKLKELKQHSASEKTFVKRFFTWFDGFMVLKFVHFAHDNFYPQQEVLEAAKQLSELCSRNFKEKISKKELLIEYRKWENPFIS